MAGDIWKAGFSAVPGASRVMLVCIIAAVLSDSRVSITNDANLSWYSTAQPRETSLAPPHYSVQCFEFLIMNCTELFERNTDSTSS